MKQWGHYNYSLSFCYTPSYIPTVSLFMVGITPIKYNSYTCFSLHHSFLSDLVGISPSLSPLPQLLHPEIATFHQHQHVMEHVALVLRSNCGTIVPDSWNGGYELFKSQEKIVSETVWLFKVRFWHPTAVALTFFFAVECAMSQHLSCLQLQSENTTI